jgi:hypothetical protein
MIRAYIAEELWLGRFSGPFTQEELELKIGPFHSSPLQVAMKEGAPGEPTKYRVCRHLSYRGKAQSSINDEIDVDKYPTRWGKVTDVAEIVCSHSISLFTPALHDTSCILVTLFSLPTHVLHFSSHSHLTPCGSLISSSLIPLLSMISLSYNFHCSHNDDNYSLFSIMVTEVICVMQAHTCDLFEGHRH